MGPAEQQDKDLREETIADMILEPHRQAVAAAVLVE
jgi:hypothetical protein